MFEKLRSLARIGGKTSEHPLCLQVRLQRRIRFQMTTGPGGLRLGPSGVGAAISCMYWEMRNMEFLV